MSVSCRNRAAEPGSVCGPGTWIARKPSPAICRAYQSASRSAASTDSTYSTTSFVAGGAAATAPRPRRAAGARPCGSAG